MDVSSHALGRESFAIKGIGDTNASAIQVTKGDEHGKGKFELEVDGTKHSFDVTKDMTKEDFANKLNNIDGFSGIEVNETSITTKPAVDKETAATVAVAIDETKLNDDGKLTLTVDGVDLELSKADLAVKNTAAAGGNPADPARDNVVKRINEQLKAGGSDVVMGATGTDDGKLGTGFTFTNDSGKAIDIKATLVDAADGATATVGGLTLKKSATPADNNVSGTTQSTNGEEKADAVTQTHFTVDFSNAKIDTDVKDISFSSTGHPSEGTTATPSEAGEPVNGDLTIGNVKTIESVKSLDLSTAKGAQNAIDVLDAAMEQVDGKRAEIGAFQNRMTHTMSNLANINENVNASNSRIKDVDFASETINMTKGQILQQAGTSILAQAKQIPQAALSLLG
nr:flagellin [Photobacterium phosphoreum]